MRPSRRQAASDRYRWVEAGVAGAVEVLLVDGRPYVTVVGGADGATGVGAGACGLTIGVGCGVGGAAGTGGGGTAPGCAALDGGGGGGGGATAFEVEDPEAVVTGDFAVGIDGSGGGGGGAEDGPALTAI